jgi:hypothetical protein
MRGNVFKLAHVAGMPSSTSLENITHEPQCSKVNAGDTSSLAAYFLMDDYSIADL